MKIIGIVPTSFDKDGSHVTGFWVYLARIAKTPNFGLIPLKKPIFVSEKNALNLNILKFYRDNEHVEVYYNEYGKISKIVKID